MLQKPGLAPVSGSFEPAGSNASHRIRIAYNGEVKYNTFDELESRPGGVEIFLALRSMLQKPG